MRGQTQAGVIIDNINLTIWSYMNLSNTSITQQNIQVEWWSMKQKQNIAMDGEKHKTSKTE